MKPVFEILLPAILYLVILGPSGGLIHPACYAYVGALLPGWNIEIRKRISVGIVRMIVYL